MRRGRWVAGSIAVVAGAGLVLAGAALWFATRWSAPLPRRVGHPPADLDARAVEFSDPIGHRLRGWLMSGRGAGGVVLVHGVGQTRRSMIGRARFLHARGYAVLLFDLPGHGESTGARIAFGAGEAGAAAAAVAFLSAAEPGAPLAALGFSLGGAALVLAAPPLPVDALVLEAVYADIDTAVANRLRLYLGRFGPWLTPLLTWQLGPRWGIDPRDLRPVDAIRRIRAPLLLIAGADDPRTTVADARRLLAAAPAPKALWVVRNAGHGDFHRAAPVEYEARVLDFLARAFRRAGARSETPRDRSHAASRPRLPIGPPHGGA